VTGYRVTPVVGLVTPPLELRLDEFEVAEVFEVPLAFLLDPANYQRKRRPLGGPRASLLRGAVWPVLHLGSHGRDAS